MPGFIGRDFSERAVQQIIGRERRGRVSQLVWCGEGCFDSRRRVNSVVIRLLLTMNTRVTNLLLVVPLLLVASSCSFTKGKQLGESAVMRFNDHFNAGEFREIYDESDDAFHKWGTEANLTDLLSTV